MGQPSSKFSVLNILAILLGAFLIFTNFQLLEQNRNLRRSLRVMERERRLEQGSVVPPLRGLDLDGKVVQYGFDTDPRSTLLFVLSPKCGVCDRNWINWQKIIASAREDEYRLLFANIDLERLPEEYLSKHGLVKWNVIDEVDPQSKIDYRIGYTPQTILIDSRGRVQEVWTGILTFTEERIQALQNKLGVDLAAADK